MYENVKFYLINFILSDINDDKLFKSNDNIYMVEYCDSEWRTFFIKNL